MADEPKLKYIVKPGVTFGANEQFKEGDVIEMTAAEAAGFPDKLELYERKASTKADAEPKSAKK